MFNFHFISGLPRSGTTLLAAILRQNPNFYSHIESPTGRIFTEIVGALGTNTEAGLMTGGEQRKSIMAAFMHGYYIPLGLPDECTIFDNNRKWCNNISAVAEVFPNASVICVVRPVAEVVDSFERVYSNNPLYANAMMRGRPNLTVYDRINLLLDPKEGVVGWSYNAVRTAYYGPERKRLIMVLYEDLARNPGEIMRMLHEKLGIEKFEYDFRNVQQIPGVEEFDRKLAAPGLHTIQPEVKYIPIPPCLPPDALTHMYKTYPVFWKKK